MWTKPGDHNHLHVLVLLYSWQAEEVKEDDKQHQLEQYIYVVQT